MADIKLELKQIFDAPIEKVWDAWTNPESLKQWKSPEGMTTPDAEIDLKVGGKYRIVMEGQDKIDPNHPGIDAVGGEYLEIEKPKKIVYSWLWESAPSAKTHNTTVTVLFNAISEDKTELTLIHSGFADENMKMEHSLGWDSTLRKLKNFLKK